MKETTTLRPIDDIWNELSNHPDFVSGSYYTKDNVIDIIANDIDSGSADNDSIDELYKDAEVILNNNFHQIQKNIDGCYEYGIDQSNFLYDCDLTIEKQNK